MTTPWQSAGSTLWTRSLGRRLSGPPGHGNSCHRCHKAEGEQHGPPIYTCEEHPQSPPAAAAPGFA